MTFFRVGKPHVIFHNVHDVDTERISQIFFSFFEFSQINEGFFIEIHIFLFQFEGSKSVTE